MARRSFPEIPRVCLQCGLAWVQRDGGPPRDYCTTTCRQEAERAARGVSQPVSEPASEPPVRVYVRRVRGKAYTITCAWCGDVATVEQYPGPAPRYCGPACRAEAAREGAAARMRRMRERRQQAPIVTRAPIS
jgi:hypothetical protein